MWASISTAVHLYIIDNSTEESAVQTFRETSPSLKMKVRNRPTKPVHYWP